MKIKFVDLNRQYQNYNVELLTAVQNILTKGNFILGEEVKEFESAFANYIGCKYAIGVGSGTSALTLSIKTLNIGPGDEVITVPNSYIATAFAISENSAKVMFVDVDEKTQLMNVQQLEAVISSNTKAIIPVHLTGQMVNMDNVLAIAKKHQVAVIEDACQAHGASQNGKKAGTFGELSCFSFYPGKNLGAYGDAGMITTNDEVLYKKLLMMRNYGSEVKYYHEFRGTNARLDTLQAAVLNVKLKYLDSWNKKRNEIAEKYLNELQNVGDLILPYIEKHNYSAFHLFSVRTKKRNELFEHLNSQGIQTIIHYPIPIHLQKAYAELKLKKGAFPIAEALADEILSLPIHPDLTNEELTYITSRIKEFF